MLQTKVLASDGFLYLSCSWVPENAMSQP